MHSDLKSFIYHSARFFLSLTLLIIITVKVWPGSEFIIFKEDGIVEDATAIADALAAILGFCAIYWGAARGRKKLERVVLITIPWLSLFCFLDEISWGARLFDLHMPAMQGGGEFDGVHDIFTVLERMIAAASPSTLLTIILIAIPVLGFGIHRAREWIWVCVDFITRNLQAQCLVSAICLLAFATYLDIFAHGRILSGLEEYSELSASFFLAFAAFKGVRLAQTSMDRIPHAKPSES